MDSNRAINRPYWADARAVRPYMHINKQLVHPFTCQQSTEMWADARAVRPTCIHRGFPHGEHCDAISAILARNITHFFSGNGPYCTPIWLRLQVTMGQDVIPFHRKKRIRTQGPFVRSINLHKNSASIDLCLTLSGHTDRASLHAYPKGNALHFLLLRSVTAGD